MGEAKKLFSNSSIVFAGSIVGAFFSYLFNMLVGRLLGPAQYGEFTALLSLLMILSVAGSAILTVTMKFSSDFFTHQQFHSIKKLFSKFSKYSLFFGLLLFFLGVIVIKPIAEFFSIIHLLPVGITLLSFIFGFLIVVNRGILQGTQEFLVLSISNGLEMALRLVVGLILIKVGLEVSGAMAGVVLATFLAYVYTLFPLIRIIRKPQDRGQADEIKISRKDIFEFTLPTLIATTLLTIALNIDVILVKHFFSPEDAGRYAAVSTIAKIILYATAPIVSVMFPMISEKRIKGDKHYKILMISFLLTLIAALAILGLYAVMPWTIIRILYGGKYPDLYYLLPQLGLAVLFYSLINLMCNYYLAVKNFIFLVFFGLVLTLQVILIWNYHNTLMDVAKILIATLALLFALIFGYYLVTKKDQLAEYIKGENE